MYVNVGNINKQSMKMNTVRSKGAKFQVSQVISCGTEEDQATPLKYVETWMDIETRAQFTCAVRG